MDDTEELAAEAEEEAAPQESFTASKIARHTRRNTRYDELALRWRDGSRYTLRYRDITSRFLSGDGTRLVLLCHPYHVRLDGFDLARIEERIAARACDSLKEHDPHRPALVGEPVIERIGLYAPRDAVTKDEEKAGDSA
jgi:hypothetical protein